MKKSLIGALLVLAVSASFAAEDLIRDFKGQFSGLSEQYKSNDLFVTKAPALKLDGSKLDSSGGNHVGKSFYIFKKEAQPLKGKPIQATLKLRRVSGNAPISIGFRVFGNGNKYMGGRSFDFNPPADGKWHDTALSFSVPDLDGIENINVQLGFRQDGKVPNIFVLDELKLLHAADSGLKPLPSASLGFAQLENKTPLKLIADGVPKFKIVVAEKPDAVALYAAEELREHVALVTGKKVEIVRGGEVSGPAVWIGDNAMSRKYGVAPSMMPPDNWVVARVGENIILSGGDAPETSRARIISRATIPLGTLFAAYEFMERVLDIRWFWPGRNGTVAPKAENISVGELFEIGTPAYTCRALFYDISKDKDIPPAEVLKWQRRVRFGGADPDPIGMHAFHNWSKKYGDKPELFALQASGKRKVDGEAGAHLCLTNPEVIERSAQEAIEYFKKNPERKFFAVMPGDSNDLYFCRCEKCQKTVSPEKGRSGKHSNAVWSYVNAVAAKVAAAAPGKYIKCCAYADYLRRPDFPLMPNVAVTLCYYTVPQGSANYKENWRKLIDEWRATGAALYIWEYWNDSRYGRGTYGAPAIYPRQLKGIYAIDRNQVRGRVIELSDIDSTGVGINSWADWIYDMPNLYIAARLMWNPDVNVNDELNRFYRDFYGPAEKPMREFYDTLEKAWLNSTWQANGKTVWDHESCWKNTYPPELVDKLMGLLREAVKLSEGKEPYAFRAKKTLEGYLPFERNSRMFRGPKPKTNPSVVDIPQGTVPVIDGKVGAEEWKGSAKLENFADSYHVYAVDSQTELFLRHDDRNLYIGVKATTPPAHKEILWANPSWGARDAFLWDAESVEFFFAGKDGERYQFIIAPDGKLFDAWWPRSSPEVQTQLGEAVKWNPAVRFATSKSGNSWEAEAAVPLKELKFQAPAGSRSFLANFARNHRFRVDPATGFKWEQSLWLPTYGSFHNVEKYGTLNLK